MNRRKLIKKLSEIVMIIAVIGAMGFILFMTIHPADEKTSYYENRMLADMEKPSQETVLDGTYFTGLEKYLADHSAYREELLELNTDADLKLFGRPVVNETVVGSDVLLSYNEYDYHGRDFRWDCREPFLKNLGKVKSAADDVGAPYYYVAVPEQHTFYADKFPWYLDSWSEYEDLEASYLSKLLPAYGIYFLDLREELMNERNRGMYSSRVDNHFSMMGAFRAYQIIMEHINNDFHEDLPVLYDEDVTFRRLKNPYMGSRERKLFNKIDLDESLYYLELDSEIPYTRRDGGHDVNPFTFLFPDNEREPVSYTFYMGGDISECVIDTDREKLPSVLIYGDSFTNAIECVLYTSFNRMYSVDLRYYDGSISDYIRRTKPDYVICARGYSTLLESFGNGRS